MKRNTNLVFSALALAFVLAVGLACDKFSSKSEPAANSAKTDNGGVYKPSGTAPENTAPKTETKVEKADFTLTAEEFDKAFTTKGVTDKDLEKYASKNIQVSGRVSLLSMEKQGTTQPWVTLFAPGLGHGVSCYFDEENLAQMKQLKMDKMVTVQGFQDDFLVPEVSPRLEHCVVIKAD